MAAQIGVPVEVRTADGKRWTAILAPSIIVKWEGPDYDAFSRRIWSDPNTTLGNVFQLLVPAGQAANLKRSAVGEIVLKSTTTNRGLRVLGATAMRTETVDRDESIMIRANGIIAILIG